MSVIMRVSATRCGSFTVIGGHQWKFQLLWLWKSSVTSWDEILRTTYIVKKIGQCAILENLHYHPKPFSYFLIFAFKFMENWLHRKLATYWRWPFWNIALQKWYDALQLIVEVRALIVRWNRLWITEQTMYLFICQVNCGCWKDS